MSGHRYASIFCLGLLIVLSGCQSDGSSRFAWNPFAKKTDAVAAEESKSSFSLPKFAKRSEEKSADDEPTARSPMAVEQLDRLLEQGQVALQESRLADAKKAYTEVIDAAPDNATAHHGMAMVADLSEQWADAEYHYRQALRMRPKDANLLCDIGYSYLLQNRYSEASRYLNHAIEINPDHESAQMNLAMLDLRQGNRAGATDRILQRYGSTAKASQILAQLDAQVGGTVEPENKEPAAVIPANATFEQIQEIARRERVEAERKRSMSGIPQDHGTAPMAATNASVLSNQNIISDAAASRPVLQPSNSNDMANRSAAVPAGSGSVVSAPMPVGGAIQNPQPWANGSNAIAGQPANTAIANTGLSNPANTVNANGMGANGMMAGSQPAINQNSYGQNPSALHVNQPPFNASVGNVGGAPLSGNVSVPTAQYPMTSGQGVNAPATNMTSGTSAAIGNLAAAGTGTGHGRITSIYPSGNFQQPQAGSSSYGQPIGFSSSTGSPPVSTATASNSMPMNQPGMSTGYGGQNGLNGNAAPQMNLEGLNVGPGSLFPIGQPPAATGQQQPAASGSSGFNSAAMGDGSLRMGNVSSPGSNSMINGTMYPAAQSHLPSQEWLSQQQEQLALQARQNGTALNGSGAASPNGNANANAWPAIRPPMVNPLESYERQKQQLDSEYNRTLQQMDRQGQPGVPRAQY